MGQLLVQNEIQSCSSSCDNKKQETAPRSSPLPWLAHPSLVIFLISGLLLPQGFVLPLPALLEGRSQASIWILDQAAKHDVCFLQACLCRLKHSAGNTQHEGELGTKTKNTKVLAGAARCFRSLHTKCAPHLLEEVCNTCNLPLRPTLDAKLSASPFQQGH